MDQAIFDRLMSNAPAAPEQQPEADPMEALAGAAEAVGLTPPTEETRPDGTPYDQPPGPEKPLGDPQGLDAVAGGAAKAIFESKDFLFGDTPEEDRSEFRRNVEETVELRGEQSIVDGFMGEVSQFATAMVGLGKARWALKGVPWVGAGLTGAEATRKGRVALEVGQAAMAGAIAFDPHEERLSNLIQGTPLANPLNEWLAADPEDGAAEGRMKAALESIGMDAVLMGVFFRGTRIWKHLRKGDMDKAGDEADKLQAEAQGAADGEEVLSAAPANDNVSAPEKPAAPLSEDGVDVEVVQNATEAKEAAGAPTPSPSPKPRVKVTDEDTAAVLTGLEADADAIAKHGGWYQAIEAGHVFGKGPGIPYEKINADADLDDFMARVVDATKERLDVLKGGDVLSDARVDRLVKNRAALYDDEPALLLGMVQKAGKDASDLVANMEASYLVGTKLFQDAYALASRISMGDLVAFGGNKLAAQEELRKRLGLAASVYGAAKSMSSNSGRALRRMRHEFKIDPEAVAAMGKLDGDVLAELLVSTKGNPRAMKKLASVSLLARATDFLGFVYVNNLVSGPMTQLINLTTNAYMLGVRPLERMIGSVVMDGLTGSNSRAILKESATQYAYMGIAMGEGFRNAARAFIKNDSILTPHKSEVYAGNVMGEASGAVRPFKPWNSVPNLIYNSMLALPTQAIGVPTRVLGTVDELMKQTTYRSKVMAGAYWEAIDKGSQAGLKDKDLEDFVRQYVTDKTDMAFDAEGRGVNAKALNEANITTFQQDLLPSTFGKSAQTLVSNHPAMRLVLPFVKTPTNVIRYGWKMMPGLNVLQTEYRQMLTGKLGEEAQRQAVGQMTIGSLFIGTAAYMASQSSITGAGPSDPKLRAELMATGWRPYSAVSMAEDGSVTYSQFSRFDPIAVPFGIIADLQDVLHAQPEDADQSELEAVIGALQIAVASQVKNKTYLMGIAQAAEAFMEPERSGFFKQVGANFLPFSAAQRQFNTDPYLREARTLADKLMSTVPGLSESVPARYDAWGDPVHVRKGLWSVSEYDLVDREVERLAMENGSTVTRPSPNHSGVDLRDITMEDGRNAYAVYQELAGHPPGEAPLKALVKQLMEGEAYRKAPDGAAPVRGTKLWFLHKPVSKYRENAMKFLKRDPVVREALMARTRQVADRYQHLSAEPETEPATLGKVGEAFGVDLGGLQADPR